MKKLKKLLNMTLFLSIGIIMFLRIQDILVLDDMPSGTPEKAMNGFWSLEENTVDVLIFGVSHPEFGISPMRLYEQTGIVSYNLASGNQPIEMSYYLLKEALKKQTPKAVLLDPVGVFEREDVGMINVAWKLLFKNFPLDDVKLELAKDYGNRPEGDGFLSTFFPIISFHDRWSSLTRKDFKPHWKGMYYTAGELLTGYVKPAITTLSELESQIVEIRKRDDGWKYSTDGNSKMPNKGKRLYYQTISEDKWGYLLKMKDLCDSIGAELILVTIPTLQFPQAGGDWNSEKSVLMKERASAAGIEYIDMLCDYDLADFRTDTFDGGFHLNCRGAGKVTAFLGDFLSTKNIPSNKNALYDEMLVKYNKVLGVAMLESEKDFYTYIDILSKNISDYSIYIIASNEYTLGMTDKDYAFISSKLGLHMIQNGKFTDSYIAVIDNGTVSHETLSNQKIEYSTSTIEGLPVDLCSAGWYVKPDASISIGGKEYAQMGRGLNIVVFDHDSGLVIDSVSFDTFQNGKPALRNWSTVDTYLRAYESKMCFGEGHE